MSHRYKFVDRFTRRSRLGRHKIQSELRDEVFKRDDFTCQYCNTKLPSEKLTIDHLIPVSRGGLDELPNYITCCGPCNQRKSNMPLEEFARTIKVSVIDLPIHGDPIIDNKELPIALRAVRKRVFDRIRTGELTITGKSAQKKIEKQYRREFWQTTEGKSLEAEFPDLPGHIRIMIPEIVTIAKSAREYILLVELAKSANTRSLIGSILTHECDVESRLRNIEGKTNDISLRKRIGQTFVRFEREIRRRDSIST